MLKLFRSALIEHFKLRVAHAVEAGRTTRRCHRKFQHRKEPAGHSPSLQGPTFATVQSPGAVAGRNGCIRQPARSTANCRVRGHCISASAGESRSRGSELLALAARETNTADRLRARVHERRGDNESALSEEAAD